METILLTLRVIVALAAVLGLIVFLQRKLAKGGKSAGPRSIKLPGLGRVKLPELGFAARMPEKKPIELIGSQRLGPKASLVLVEIDGRRMVVGVTDQGVSLIDGGATAASAPAEATDESPVPAGFAPVPARDRAREVGLPALADVAARDLPQPGDFARLLSEVEAAAEASLPARGATATSEFAADGVDDLALAELAEAIVRTGELPVDGVRWRPRTHATGEAGAAGTLAPATPLAVPLLEHLPVLQRVT
jgi:flagellar protein FliO/FliZ